MARPRVRLGELLVEAGILTSEQLEEVLALQKHDGRRLGTLLVESGLVTETQVTQILSQQLSVPWVSLHHIEFSRPLLDLVPHDVAEKYCLVPIFVRRVRGYGNTLYIAMDDPSDEKAQAEVTRFSGLPVRTMIAPPSDIRSAIRVYYAAGEGAEAEAAGTSDVQPEGVHPFEGETPPAEAPPSEELPSPDEPRAPVAGEGEPAPDSSPQIEAHEIELPRPRRGKGRRMITLTLLDGTEINLPAHGDKTGDSAVQGARPVESELTAGDLVLALRAVAQGANAKENLGESPKWENMFAALLALLLKKHLIADWEFVEEYKKGSNVGG